MSRFNFCRIILSLVTTVDKSAINSSVSNRFRYHTTTNASKISSSVKTTSKPRNNLKGKSAPIILTSAAVNRVRELLAKNPEALGLRIGVRTRGCNGLSYTLDFCLTGKKPDDEVVEQDGVRIYVDRRAQLSLLGTEMDFQQDLLVSQFVFNNPNIKGTCGCGESFSV